MLNAGKDYKTVLDLQILMSRVDLFKFDHVMGRMNAICDAIEARTAIAKDWDWGFTAGVK